MPPPLLDPGLQLAFELVGIVAFAVSGALLAIRKDFDIVGIVLLAGITALGGGVVRDVLIGATPPVAFTHLGYFLMPVGAAAVAFFAHRVIERLTTAVLVFDAAGLGVFCVLGTLKALDHGLRPLAAAALWELDLRGPWTAAGAVAFIFAFRLLAMARHWHAPRAWRRRP